MRNPEELQSLVDHVEIRQLLARHSRGIDRCDAALLDAVWDPTGHVAYGFFSGAPREFSATVTGLMRGGPLTLHRTSNLWVRCRGDLAVSESYVLAFTSSREEGVDPLQTLIGGRYLDRFARTGSGWRMVGRQYLMEWNLNRVAAGASVAGSSGPPGHRGGHGEADPSDQFLRLPAGRPHAPSKQDSGDFPMQIQPQLLADVEAALARLAIHDLIMAQARGADRRDAGLLRSVWHDDAIVDVGFYAGPAVGYTEAFFNATAAITRMHHSVANEWIEVRGETAVAESYVVAFTTAPAVTGSNDTLVGGRYLDRFERRSGVWKFTERRFVLDSSMEFPSSDRSQTGMLSMLTFGGRFPDDPVYALWSSLQPVAGGSRPAAPSGRRSLRRMKKSRTGPFLQPLMEQETCHARQRWPSASHAAVRCPRDCPVAAPVGFRCFAACPR